MLKTHTLEVRRNFIALGCPINDVLDFGGPFLPLGWGSFFQKRGFFNISHPCYRQLRVVCGESKPPRYGGRVWLWHSLQSGSSSCSIAFRLPRTSRRSETACCRE